RRDVRAEIRRVGNSKLDFRDDGGMCRVADIDDSREPAARLPLRACRGPPASLVLEDDVRLPGDGDRQRVLRADAAVVPGERADDAILRIRIGVRLEVADVDDGESVCRRTGRSEEHTSELQSLAYLVCRLLLEKKK